jgi:hypothetical protein
VLCTSIKINDFTGNEIDEKGGSEKSFDVWRVVDDYYGQAVGKFQVESMMSTAASLFPQ